MSKTLYSCFSCLILLSLISSSPLSCFAEEESAETHSTEADIIYYAYAGNNDDGSQDKPRNPVEEELEKEEIEAQSKDYIIIPDDGSKLSYIDGEETLTPASLLPVTYDGIAINSLIVSIAISGLMCIVSRKMLRG